jgi:flavorubredoxin
MPSGNARRYDMDIIGKLDIQMIAPQHGSLFTNKKEIDLIIERLKTFKGVGIDGILNN